MLNIELDLLMDIDLDLDQDLDLDLGADLELDNCKERGPLYQYLKSTLTGITSSQNFADIKITL